jgi:hypothetical protein
LFEADIEGQRPPKGRAINTDQGIWMRRRGNHLGLTEVASAFPCWLDASIASQLCGLVVFSSYLALLCLEDLLHDFPHVIQSKWLG